MNFKKWTHPLITEITKVLLTQVGLIDWSSGSYTTAGLLVQTLIHVRRFF